MLRTRPVWMRGLRVYRAMASETLMSTSECADELLDARVHARSRFRSQEDPSRFAIYTVHDAEAWAPPTPVAEPGDHTLIVVREFRRVPLHASALAMLLLTARSGCSAPVLAALAHFVERAVSVYQPAYLLLARSMEAPGSVVLITGVHERAAFVAMQPSAFSLDPLMPEIGPLLEDAPEWYVYCHEEEELVTVGAVSRRAV